MPFLADNTRAAVERVLALDDVTEQTGLEQLAALRGLITALEADPASLAAVRGAEESGASWEQVGAAAGLSPAAAKARWQGSDDEIAERQQASRKRSVRPSAKPVDLPGLSVAEAAEKLGVSVQAIYLRVTRGQLDAQTVELPDGRKYKRVFLTPHTADASTD